MQQEVQEESVMEGTTPSPDHHQGSYVLKGKRTKRQRPVSPLVLTMAAPSSSYYSSAPASAGGYADSSSPSNSCEFTQTTLDEEDMANCLILLAQGRRRSKKSPESVLATMSNNNSNLNASTSAAAAEAYQCKTCNRCFPSFQALGGHRASHKKPKVNPPEEKLIKPAVFGNHDLENPQFNDDNTALSLQISSRDSITSSTNNKSRVHECSICGAEFSSGQALGGHMRRHRPVATTTTSSGGGGGGGGHEYSSQEVKKSRTLLSLDLNLPAPEDHDHNRESNKFPFGSKEQVIVFSASPLVDCHY
ncbi:hypothetical protein M9H77_01955 [Catharanthus roseus]|uniref:Uncharacterized protein n=1 Tax=Catharanthus roseus TaxID=4058 RepID=A0ACC0C7I0_CATRO|nr:hypothetical protein M9H77_01955 [Catharanthus roseus]